MPTVQFSLNARQVEILESFAQEDESLNLTAKRVLTEFLSSIPNQGKAELSRALELDHGDDQRMIDEIEPLIDKDLNLTSTKWHLHCLDARIKAIEMAIEADHYPSQDELTNRPETIAELEERIEKLEAFGRGYGYPFVKIDDLKEQIDKVEIANTNRIESIEKEIEKLQTEVEILNALSKQPATPNNAESVIFLADSGGEPIQFWTGQVWTDDLNLAYRYKGAQAMARTMDKLKKRKLPGEELPGAAIACAPIEKLLENGES